MGEKITIENEFLKLDEIKTAKKGLAALTGCPEELIEVYVQGHFDIANRSPWTSDLNLDYGWHKVSDLGRKYLEVYVGGEEKKWFRAEPDREHFRLFNRKPGFRLVAEVFNNLSFRY